MEEKCLIPEREVIRSNSSTVKEGTVTVEMTAWTHLAWAGAGAAPCPEHTPRCSKQHTRTAQPPPGCSKQSCHSPNVHRRGGRLLSANAPQPLDATGGRAAWLCLEGWGSSWGRVTSWLVTWCWSPAAPWSQCALLFRAFFNASYEKQDISRKVFPLTLLTKPTAVVTTDHCLKTRVPFHAPLSPVKGTSRPDVAVPSSTQ